MKNARIILLCMLTLAACTKPAEQAPAPVVEAAPPADFEIADLKYMDIGKAGIAALSAGDIDGWMNGYADNAKYYWSGGDSLIGKPAIAAYWKERRTNVIDSISFTNDIWMPVKVNKSQRGPDRPGVWLFGWYFTNVKYKNNQRVMLWIHTDMHFNDQDKIDQVVMYFDRAPINAALAKKKK